MYDLLKECKEAGLPIKFVYRHDFNYVEEDFKDIYTCKLCGEIKEVTTSGLSNTTLGNLFHTGCLKAEPEGHCSLEEAIEWCGNKGFMLVFRPYGKWVAHVSFQDGNTNIIYKEAEGDTPLEAVLRLWLALNKGNKNSDHSDKKD